MAAACGDHAGHCVHQRALRDDREADLNGDGTPDLAVTNNSSNTVSVLLNMTATGSTTPSFAAKVDFTIGANPYSVAIGDLDGNGTPDLAVANANSNTVSVFLNTTATGSTTPSFAAKVDFTTGGGPISIAIADLDGDGTPDLAVANEASNTVSALLNTTATGSTTPSFAAKVDFTTGAAPFSVAIADLDGDGTPDLAVANRVSNTVSVLVNTTATGSTNPSFAAKVDFTTGGGPFSVAIADLNGDGKPDLGVANVNSNTVSVLLAR
ncbi:MAG: VCBS repeat-containing protein [Kofleriaceae bacterium]